MKKVNDSGFESIEDIICGLEFNYNKDTYDKLEELKKYWKDLTGEKISKVSKVYNFSDDSVLTVICADSFTANELYFGKDNLIKYMNDKTQNLGIIIKDIKFNYKKWKERYEE